MGIPRIKIYGERNTGTKYLDHLIALNLQAEVLPGVEDLKQWHFFKRAESAWWYEYSCDLYFLLNFRQTLGWKHMMPLPPILYCLLGRPAADTLFITLTKNPYAWLLSLYSHPWHTAVRYSSFEQFLTHPWKPQLRENTLGAFANPMRLWNRKNRAYLRLKSPHCTTLNLTYEELVRDPAACIQQIAGVKNIPLKSPVFVNCEETTSRAEPRKKTYADYRGYYLQEKWRACLTDHQLELINPHLDEVLMAQFGYARLNSVISSSASAPPTSPQPSPIRTE